MFQSENEKCGMIEGGTEYSGWRTKIGQRERETKKDTVRVGEWGFEVSKISLVSLFFSK
jgi:hypothetical protein